MNQKEHSFLALSFLLLLFLLFLLFKPTITGQTTALSSSPLTQQIIGQTLNGSFTLTLQQGDKIKTNALLTLSLVNGTDLYALNITSISTIFNSLGITPDSSPFGQSYNRAGSYIIPFSYFNNFKPSIPGTATLIINLSDDTTSVTTVTPLTILGFTTVQALSSKSFLSLFNGNYSFEFKNNDLIFCSFNYLGTANKRVSFYQPGDSITTPSLTLSNTDVSCDPAEPTSCAVAYQVNTTKKGLWICLVRLTAPDGRYIEKIASNNLLMINTAPLQIKNFETINLNQSATLDLDTYFKDPDKDPLTYEIIGARNTLAAIHGNILALSNAQHLSTTENLLILAYDGYEEATANLTILLQGTTTQEQTLNTTNCTPIWQCSEGLCVHGFKTKTCSTDTNTCGEATPAPTQTPCQETLPTRTQQKINLSSIPIDLKKESAPVGLGKILLLILGIVFILSGVGIYIYQRKKKPEETQQTITQETQTLPSQQTIIQQTITQETQNLDELDRYIEDGLAQGKKPEELKQELIQAGWQETDIIKALAYLGAKKYCKDKLSQGYTKEQLTLTLKSKKWKDENIEKIFKELQATQ